MTCRSMAPDDWERVRESLIFYFLRRHGFSNAEDLAQDTIAALLKRDDYEFESEADFLKVCYGFADKISRAGWRKIARYAADPLDPNLTSRGSRVRGLNEAELQ